MKSHNWTNPLDHTCNCVHTTQGGRSFVNAQLAFIETSDMPEKLLFLKNVVIEIVSTKKAAGASLDCSHSMTRPSFTGLRSTYQPLPKCICHGLSSRGLIFPCQPCMGCDRLFFIAFSPITMMTTAGTMYGARPGLFSQSFFSSHQL